MGGFGGVGLRGRLGRLRGELAGVLARRGDELRGDPAEVARVLGYDVRPFHGEWLEFQRVWRKSLLLAPRGHGKSTVAGVAFVLWKVLVNPDVRVLVVSNTHEQARVFLREIRGQVEGCGVLRGVFGDLRGSRWSEGELVVRRGRIAKEGTVTACGANGLVVGRHFDVIVADDVVDEENSWCENQRGKLLTWFNKSLFPCLEPGGELHVIGTRYHGGDLYGEILRRAERVGEGDGWGVRLDVAVGDGGALWPERFSLGRLDEVRGEMGEVAFACQFMNDPRGGDAGVFKEEWFQFYETLPMEEGVCGLGPASLRVFQGVDLAISQSDSADYFAVVTVGVDRDHNVFVLDTFRGRLSFEKQVQKVRDLAGRFHPVRIAVESNAYQDVLSSELVRTAGLPVRRVRQRRDKFTRAMRLSPQFENGKVFLKRSMTELLAELQLFPRGGHDDLFDALEMAVSESVGCVVREGRY